MTTRERSQRDTQIAALADAGAPARKIAAQFGLSKRQCNRVIAMRREEREQRAPWERARIDAPTSSPLELLDRLEELFLDACGPPVARRALNTGALLRAGIEQQLSWREYRAALEKWIADALRAKSAGC